MSIVDTVITVRPAGHQRADRPALFSVFIDVWCGLRPQPEWERNSVPKPLADALEEARDARRAHFPAKVEPEA